MSDFDFRAYEHKRTSVLLGESIARLSDALEKGNAVLERKGTRAVRNRLVREMRVMMVLYRVFMHYGDHAQPHHLATELGKHDGFLKALVPLPSRGPQPEPILGRPTLRLVGGTAVEESHYGFDGRNYEGGADAA